MFSKIETLRIVLTILNAHFRINTPTTREIREYYCLYRIFTTCHIIILTPEAVQSISSMLNRHLLISLMTGLNLSNLLHIVLLMRNIDFGAIVLYFHYHLLQNSYKVPNASLHPAIPVE